MAQLIQMRQRIKTVETIKKITHAMRLIAMAAHGHLKNQRGALERYQHNLAQVFGDVRAKMSEWQPVFFDTSGATARKLIILIGSQKGLCGNFNSVIFDFFSKEIPYIDGSTLIIAVGKNAAEFLEKKYQIQPALFISSITITTCFSAAQKIVAFMLHHGPFAAAQVASNFPKSFFLQYPQLVDLASLLAQPLQVADEQAEYIFEEPPRQVLDQVANMYITAVIQMLLLESLLAEQAARFISMDNSTRNAENLLETTRLSYNKLRQAKITSELIELSTSDV